MSIKSIDIKNFTVFENIKCEFSPGINIFMGENGTGKTHMLKILYAITNTEKYNKSFESENKFQGMPIAISNNFEHVILPLFNAPVEHMAVNLVRNKPDNSESAKIEVNTDKEIVNAYVAELGSLVAVNPSDKVGSLFEQESFFIPAKDMLSHSGIENDFMKRLLPLDRTQIDILNNLRVSRLREQTELSKTLMKKLSDILGGSVLYMHGGYFIDKGNRRVNIAHEAEGHKKLAVIYRALDTGYLQPGSILLWDEPEANLSLKLIPAIVDILMELARNGVQIFLATHEYNLMNYFSIRKKEGDQVAFISLRKTENGVVSEIEDDYELLGHNPIIEANINMLEDKYDGCL